MTDGVRRQGHLTIGGHLAWVIGASWLSACISTEFESTDSSSLACTERVSGSVAEDAVVLVRGRLGSIGSRFCSGVVVAPRLVATGLGCVVGLNDPTASDPPLDEPTVFRGVATASEDYDSLCRRDLEWIPVEDGTFYAALGRVLRPEALSIEVIRQPVGDPTDETIPRSNFLVDRILTSRATSNCKDDVAILVLQAEIDVAPAPVRIEETTELGEAVSMVGYCVTENTGDWATDRLESYVEAITFETSATAAPPRAIVVPQMLSLFASGGAVYSSDTGALIGVIASGQFPSCGQSTMGETIAFRASAFRELFISAARAAVLPLRTELRADLPTSEQPPACPIPHAD